MPSQLSMHIQPGPLRGALIMGWAVVARALWPYKPVAHSSARR